MQNFLFFGEKIPFFKFWQILSKKLWYFISFIFSISYQSFWFLFKHFDFSRTSHENFGILIQIVQFLSQCLMFQRNWIFYKTICLFTNFSNFEFFKIVLLKTFFIKIYSHKSVIFLLKNTQFFVSCFKFFVF